MTPTRHTPRSAVLKKTLPGLVLACVLAAPARAEDKLPSADKLLKLHMEALGGQSKLADVKTRVTEATFAVPAQNIEGKMLAYERAPDHSIASIEIPGMGTIKQGCNGEICWQLHTMMGPRILEGTEAEAMRRQVMYQGLLRAKKFYKDMKVAGVETKRDRPCYKLIMTPESGKAETWFVDKENHLLVQLTVMHQSPMGELPVNVLFDDYKEVDGIMVPHKTTEQAAGMEQVARITKIQHNVDVPKDAFELPSEIKALKSKADDKSAP